MTKKSQGQPTHPGVHIKTAVLPDGMSVTEAAELLSVGRPALSNLLNGNAALSPEMAAKIERSFGVSATKLMDMQTAYDSAAAITRDVAAAAKTYVPPFLQFKADDITAWSKSISSRARFAVLLRTLVHSTSGGLRKVEFHGNDDAERPGWDGFIEAEVGSPWVPVGKSGWEFGVNQEATPKANSDYKKSLKQVAEAERKETTFVFATPTRWKYKDKWLKDRRAENYWKDVRAFDSSDLEQWLEQSIPAQAWFANERGESPMGVISLDQCWRLWVADTNPPLHPSLFEIAISKARKTVTEKFLGQQSGSLVISADSVDEALGFLSCLFSRDDPQLAALRDRVAVFNVSGTLPKLASKNSGFIAVVTSREIEKELAPYRSTLRSIVVYPRNTTVSEPDIALEPLSWQNFVKALEPMGLDRDQIMRYGHETGHSLTVLRRRLSGTAAIQTPNWTQDNDTASKLISYLLAGSWNSENAADKAALELLPRCASYEEFDKRFAELLKLEDTPLWSAGPFRGLVSKIDTLFAIASFVTWSDIQKFLQLASLILSEDNPALDLPDEERWWAGIDGKKREISEVLRDGICETLVLLSVHGNFLFKKRLGKDIEAEVSNVVREILSPLTARKLEAQSNELPMYAEASPHTVLGMLETDLKSEKPQTLELLRPASTGIFGGCPRTGLLWALENLAWSPAYLIRVIDVLAELAKIDINDNWANKPIGSLRDIFRGWMPQTAADLEQRIAALDHLVREYPGVGWKICNEQVQSRSQVGSYSHKPRWRTDGQGHGQPIRERKIILVFRLHALELMLSWPAHTRETLGDLVKIVSDLDEDHQRRVWALIADWSGHASEADKVWLREEIRVNASGRRHVKRAEKKGRKVTISEQAQIAYESLKPESIVLEHEWLFRNAWIEESVEELTDDEDSFVKREERIRALRVSALKEVFIERGMEGIFELAECGDAVFVIGRHLPAALDDDQEVAKALRFCLDQGALSESRLRQQLVDGITATLVFDRGRQGLELARSALEPQEVLSVLLVCPFQPEVWNYIEEIHPNLEGEYWKEINPFGLIKESAQIQRATRKLIQARRPRAAFHFVHLAFRKLPAKQLYQLMQAMGTQSDEQPGSYLLNPHDIRSAFKALDESGEVSQGEMASLEFQYLDALAHERGGIPNLERQIEEEPDFFVATVAFLYKRKNGGEDPDPYRSETPEESEMRASRAFKLLEQFSRVPGHDISGKLNKDNIIEWVQHVRAACKKLDREEVADSCIGNLLARAPTGDDGVWPCAPVRDALEEICSDEMEKGILTGLYNSRGLHWRGEGGDQERELAEKYERWARPIEFTHSKTHKILTEKARRYRKEADWQDDHAAARRRLHD